MLLSGVFASAAWSQVAVEKGPDGDVTQTQQPVYTCKVYDEDGSVAQRYESTEPPPDFDVPPGGEVSCIGGASEEIQDTTGNNASQESSQVAQSEHSEEQYPPDEGKDTVTSLPATGGPRFEPIGLGVLSVYLGWCLWRVGQWQE